MTLFFQTADAFLQFVTTFSGAQYGQAIGDFLQADLETLSETLMHRLFFLFTLFRTTLQTNRSLFGIFNRLNA